MQRAAVVLPEPDSPTSARHDPRGARTRGRPRPSSAIARLPYVAASPSTASTGAALAVGSARRRAGRRARAAASRSNSGQRTVAPRRGRQRRQRDGAGRHGLVAARREGAARAATRRRPPRRRASTTSRRGERVIGDRASRPRVYGWRGRVAASRRGAVLDDPACVQHGDPVGDLGHDGEVVRDVHQRDAELVADAADLGQHARLRDDVEARRRLVEHDHAAARRRARSRSPRAAAGRPRARADSAAGRLVGGQADGAEQRSRPPCAARRRATSSIVLHRAADPHRRVERRGRDPGHVRDLPPAHAPHGALVAERQPLAGDATVPAAIACPAARTRAARAPSSSCRSPTRRRARASRPARASSVDVLDDRRPAARARPAGPRDVRAPAGAHAPRSARPERPRLRARARRRRGSPRS